MGPAQNAETERGMAENFAEKKGKSGKLFFKFRRFSKNSAFFSYLKSGIPHFKKNKIKRGKKNKLRKKF